MENEKTGVNVDTPKIHLQIQGVSKSYGGVTVLSKSNLEFFEGEVHALVGENGAGKSTLCKIIAGAIQPDGGSITVHGHKYAGFSPASAKQAGIGIIYQEFNLVNGLSIYENLFLGKELRSGIQLRKSEMISEAKRIFREMEVDIDPLKTVSEISVAYCQLVEIAKALLEQQSLLILDEPTAPLTSQEADVLFRIVRKLKAQKKTIIYISHRMEEVFALCDRITVMRNGSIVQTMPTADANVDLLIRLMIGQAQGAMEYPTRTSANKGDVILSARNLCSAKLRDISFDLHRGEILGLAGLVGSGRTETARAIFGADRITSGEFFLNGTPVSFRNPKDAICHGIALIPEDRKRQGAFLDLSIRYNTTLVVVNQFSRLLTVSRVKESASINSYMQKLRIKANNIEAPVKSLSGGNQQKVILSKWLMTHADIFIFDEPTRGIDIIAKQQIYELMDQLRQEGKGIILISSEMHEIMGLSDRIITLYEGQIMGELGWQEATQERILRLASGIRTNIKAVEEG